MGYQSKSPGLVRTGANFSKNKPILLNNHELTAWCSATPEEIIDQINHVTDGN